MPIDHRKEKSSLLPLTNIQTGFQYPQMFKKM